MDKQTNIKVVLGDGNAFAIMGACQKAARRAGMPQEEINKIFDEMTAGDYDNLLRVAMTYFDVCLEGDDDDDY